MLECHIKLLRPGGKLVTVIPEGILSNKNDSRVRRFILRHCVVKAVVRLPQDAFRMSDGAACTSILYALKKNPDDQELREQGDIFFARAEWIGITPSGKPIPQNDLLLIQEQFRRFAVDHWDGIAIQQLPGDRMQVVGGENREDEGLWLEPTVNRTSLLYDRLCYVLRSAEVADRFSYTFFHPAYYEALAALDFMAADVVHLEALCVKGYPSRGRKPAEEALEGIPILKVRNVTGSGINLETEYAPDTETIRAECSRALVKQGDILVTSTGEGTIGRVDVYPYEDAAIVDGHITICRLQPNVNVTYVAEILRSEYGQIQMLRYVSGSTGQTELLVDHVRSLRVPLPAPAIQDRVVETMRTAREAIRELHLEADRLRDEGAKRLAAARRDMARLLAPPAHNANVPRLT